MTDLIKQYDVVALIEDIPEEHLLRGHVGTVIEIYAPDAFEVEFSDRRNGITFARVFFVPINCWCCVIRHQNPTKAILLPNLAP